MSFRPVSGRGFQRTLGDGFGVARRFYKRAGPTDLGGWFGVALRDPWLPSSTAPGAEAVSHQRLRYDFSLPWAKRWRRLLPMPNAGTVQERIAAPDPGWVAPPAPRLRSSCASARPGGDTLHFNLDVAGSAAQFNQSVSAMPAIPSRTFPRPPHQGTGDILCKGYPS